MFFTAFLYTCINEINSLNNKRVSNNKKPKLREELDSVVYDIFILRILEWAKHSLKQDYKKQIEICKKHCEIKDYEVYKVYADIISGK